MKNLAGVKECDSDIQEELNEAGIEIQKIELGKTEVPYTLMGKLGSFEFCRSWYYWVVKGDVPLEAAQEMYVNEIGRKDVRVAGNCGCPPPEEWALPTNIDEILSDMKIASIGIKELRDMCNEGKIVGPRFVSTYHIDSQEGLNLFTETLRKHNLV